MNRGAERIDQVLGRLLARGPLREGLDRQTALDIWPDVVGPEIARRSRAISLHDGVLKVEVDGSVWAQELQLLREHILGAFAARLGDGAVTHIRFDSGSGR